MANNDTVVTVRLNPEEMEYLNEIKEMLNARVGDFVGETTNGVALRWALRMQGVKVRHYKPIDKQCCVCGSTNDLYIVTPEGGNDYTLKRYCFEHLPE